MRIRAFALALLASLVLLFAVPTVAMAHDFHGHDHHADHCDHDATHPHC